MFSIITTTYIFYEPRKQIHKNTNSSYIRMVIFPQIFFNKHVLFYDLKGT